MKLILDPRLKGMKELDKDLFKMKLTVPAIKLKKHDYAKMKRFLGRYTFDSVISCKRFQDLDSSDALYQSHKYLLLDPDLFNLKTIDASFREELFNLLKSDETKSELKEDDLIEQLPIELDYDDFKFDDVIKSIIPDNLLNENVNVKGYSVIGHIAHFNLRDKILEYKNLIGQVLLDKIPTIQTVVNKINEIDNTYRNFSFEILAGRNDTIVKCRENGCEFQFDFSSVYWNPRLSTEHERIVNMLNQNDVVYDCFAGVGPFSIPAISKKKCSFVLANDLNPNSYRFLLDNYKLNNKSKLKKREQDLRNFLVKDAAVPNSLLNSNEIFKFDPKQSFLAFNLDANEFIKKKLKYHLIEFLNFNLNNNGTNEEKLEKLSKIKFVVLMNLPAMSIEFLPSFKNLYTKNETKIIEAEFSSEIREKIALKIFCYHFSKNTDDELNAIKKKITHEIFKKNDLNIESKYVRKVAPNKDMYCSMFTLKIDDLFTTENKIEEDNKLNQVCSQNENEDKQPPAKIAKLD